MSGGTVELIQGLLLAFAFVVILMPGYIRVMRWLGFAKQIRVDGPEGHMSKAGTPTSGGALLILVIAVLALVFNLIDASTFAPLAALGLVGLLGLVDDYLNAKTGFGISVRQKLAWQIVVALYAAQQIQHTYAIESIAVPFVGDVQIASWVFIAFAAFAIIATSNGVNITDGLDGLSGGTLVFAFVPFIIIALFNTPLQPNLALLCCIVIGSLMGFLWFNAHPAQIFMGDAGSLGFGAMLAVVSMITGQLLLLPLIGIIFVMETGSVVLQVAYFKATGGRRLFRFTPIHHHFELGGWDEEKITLRFWIIGILAGLLGVTFFLASMKLLP